MILLFTLFSFTLFQLFLFYLLWFYFGCFFVYFFVFFGLLVVFVDVGIGWVELWKKMHRPGIEPGSTAWKAIILPLNHRCLDISSFLFCTKLLFFSTQHTLLQKIIPIFQGFQRIQGI